MVKKGDQVEIGGQVEKRRPGIKMAEKGVVDFRLRLILVTLFYMKAKKVRLSKSPLRPRLWGLFPHGFEVKRA